MKKTSEAMEQQLGSFIMGDNLEVLLISSDHVKKVIDMEAAIELMSEAFIRLSRKECYVPLRSVVENPGKKITMFFKPAFNEASGRFAVKFLTQNENNHSRGIPTITGIIMLMDEVSGRIVAVIDGTHITALRTGAAGGLATRLFSREKSKSFALFGCGAQGRTQLEAVLAVRDIKTVYLFDPNQEAAEKLISAMHSETNANIIYATDLELLKEVDIISTATGSYKPLFQMEHLKPGVHINAIGAYKPTMQELDSEIVKESSLFVDDKEACIAEAGDIIIPMQMGLINEYHVIAEIGDVVIGNHQGRSSEDEITVFKSVGIAIQDLLVANAVYERYMD